MSIYIHCPNCGKKELCFVTVHSIVKVTGNRELKTEFKQSFINHSCPKDE